jgi:NitT/TauT family transport system permease protein
MNGRILTRIGDIGWPIGILLTIGILWEGAVLLLDIPSYVLPSLGDLCNELVNSFAYFFDNALFTLRNTLIGFALATVIGVGIAICIVSVRVLDRIFTTLLALLHSLPKVALAPLLVFWLGTGSSQKILIAILASIFVIVIDTVVGMRSIDPEIISMARVKRASALQILFKLRMYQALPNLFGALKAAAAFALIGALVGEFVGGEQGLGYVILVAQGVFNTARAFVAVILLGLIGTALFYLIVLAEAYFLPWHVSNRHKYV